MWAGWLAIILATAPQTDAEKSRALFKLLEESSHNPCSDAGTGLMIYMLWHDRLVRRTVARPPSAQNNSSDAGFVFTPHSEEAEEYISPSAVAADVDPFCRREIEDGKWPEDAKKLVDRAAHDESLREIVCRLNLPAGRPMFEAWIREAGSADGGVDVAAGCAAALEAGKGSDLSAMAFLSEQYERQGMKHKNQAEWKGCGVDMLAAAETMPAHSRHADRLIKAAWCFQKAKLVGQALKARTELISMHPGDPRVRDALFEVAAAYHQLAYYTKAAECYEAFARVFPKDVRAKKALANVREFREAINGRAEDCIDGLELSPVRTSSRRRTPSP